MFKDIPLRRKVIAMLLLTSGTVLLLTCIAFIAYEFQAFRQNMLRNTATLGQVIATNATAALAFDNQDDAREILSALKAEPQVVAAALYTSDGSLFATYPTNRVESSFPTTVPEDGYRFADAYLTGAQPVQQGDNRRLGTLYLQLDQRALYMQLRLYSLIALTMTAVAFLIAYLLSRSLQRQISEPILNLAHTASTVAAQHDYSLRTQKLGEDEVGALTDAFNKMLAQIQAQDHTVRENEARVRAVLNSALSAVVVIDHNGRIIEWNPRAELMFGWSRDEALGLDLADTIIPVALRESHRRGIQTYLASGHGPVLNRQVELSALHRNGDVFAVELSISPVQTGGVTTFCGFITDITDRKQAQRRVQEQLNRLDLLHRITRAIGERQDLQSIFRVVLRNLEDNLPIDFGCICFYDATRRILTVSSVGARSMALAANMHMTEQADIPIDENGLSRCVQGHLVHEADVEAIPFPFPQRLAAGGLRSLVAAPLLAESRVFGVLIASRHAANSFKSADCEFLRQLSEHVALAAHQVQLYDALQQAYEDLRQSQQLTMQQERLRALGQMASGVAHDINNAISPVTLYTESLLEREPNLSERARNYLSTIQRAIEDVARTVNRMREFYRPREAQVSLARIDLNNIALQVIELTRAKWRDVPQQRGIVIELRTELSPQLPPAMGADNEIRDALTNLIFNAVDAMPEGGTLTVRTRNVSNNSVLEVTDTGVGMDEQTRRHCLEPFFTTKGERGTGMGLAMVYGMVQRHSAELTIDSTPGIGTTVGFVFPGVATATNGLDRQRTPTTPTTPLRVLLVDDDALIIEALREILQRDGHSIVAADGGQAGIDAFLASCSSNTDRRSTIDVVITDLGMPYVDGRRVAMAIKTASPTTPVIMLTGWGQRLLDDGDAPAHVDRVLSKPPQLNELRRALSELITAKPASAS